MLVYTACGQAVYNPLTRQKLSMKQLRRQLDTSNVTSAGGAGQEDS